MQIQILRKWYSNLSTIGIISVNSIKCGFTLEDVARPFGVKVRGQTAIPGGDYEVVNTYSPKFQKITPEILNVADFVGVRFHGGNRPEDTEGCILVGLHKASDMIYDCQSVFDYLVHSIKEAQEKKEKVTLSIINTANLE